MPTKDTRFFSVFKHVRGVKSHYLPAGIVRIWIVFFALAPLFYPSQGWSQSAAENKASEGEGKKANPDKKKKAGVSPAGDEPPLIMGEEAGGTAMPEWRWRHIVAAPRIGSELRTIVGDPSNPDRMLVAVDDGTILLTEDAGLTWESFDVWLMARKGYGHYFPAPGPPGVETNANNLGPPPETTSDVKIDAAGLLRYRIRFLRNSPFSLPRPYEATPLVTRPSLPSPINRTKVAPGPFTYFPAIAGVAPRIGNVRGAVAGPPPQTSVSTIWGGATRAAPVASPSEIKDIALCPKADHEILVATEHELWGARKGDPYVYELLFVTPGDALVTQVTCSSFRAHEMAVATSTGVFRSGDDGISFSDAPIHMSFGGNAGASTASYAPDAPTLYGSSNESTWVIEDIDKVEESSHGIYPEVRALHLIDLPGDVRFMAVRPNKVLWMSTNTGIRKSEDGGAHWTVVAPTLFDRQFCRKILVGLNEQGGERVSVLCQENLYASDDGGNSWFIFFPGVPGNVMQSLAFSRPLKGSTSTGSWWITRGGEVWSTSAPPKATPSESAAVREWARKRLATMPPVRGVTNLVLQQAGLTPEQTGAVMTGLKVRHWVPRVETTFRYSTTFLPLERAVTLSQPTVAQRETGKAGYEAFVYASWFLPDMLFPRETIDNIGASTTNLRKNFIAISQAAWQERHQILRRLETGGLGQLATQTSLVRLETLDALLTTMTEGIGHHMREEDLKPSQRK